MDSPSTNEKLYLSYPSNFIGYKNHVTSTSNENASHKLNHRFTINYCIILLFRFIILYLRCVLSFSVCFNAK
jgi:hypothetical protein